ncbi:unnamed protein product [Cutaneotrichosporon oleaginosum]
MNAAPADDPAPVHRNGGVRGGGSALGTRELGLCQGPPLAHLIITCTNKSVARGVRRLRSAESPQGPPHSYSS